MSRKVRQLVQIEEKFNGDFLARFADIFLRFIDVLRQNYSSRLLLNNRHRKLLLHNLAPIVVSYWNIPLLHITNIFAT